MIIGKVSVRDEKEPQLIVNRVHPLKDYADALARPVYEKAEREDMAHSKLYLRLPSENDPAYRKVRAILQMFPGKNEIVLYFADTKLRRGTHSSLEPIMLGELRTLLGEANVVVK